jgi:N-acetylglucosamine malate deacetylase 1
MRPPLPFKRALFLGAHTDDEFGCAGTLLRLIEGGSEVFFHAFSTCEESVPDGFERDVLAREVLEATAALGIKRDNVRVGKYRVRHFPAARQEILEELVRMGREIKPDVVFVPALSDIHQDHHVVAMEGLRAFKYTSILGYELPMNSVTFAHAGFVSLEERHVAGKLLALGCYKSQNFRPYVSADFVQGLARVRGVQAGVSLAEAFEVIRVNF